MKLIVDSLLHLRKEKFFPDKTFFIFPAKSFPAKKSQNDRCKKALKRGAR